MSTTLDSSDAGARSSRTPTAALLRRACDPATARSRADDQALLARYAERRDPRVRDAIVERHLPLARSIARRYCRTPGPIDDVTQIAYLTLVEAVERYDPAYGVAFSSYVVPSIAGAVKRYYRDHTWALRVPRDLQELVLRVERVADDLAGPLHRRPSADEVAARLGVRVDDVLEALLAASAHRAESLDGLRAGGRADETLGQSVGDSDPAFRRADERQLLQTLMRHLTARERLVIRLHFDHDLTQAEIGARLDVSQMTVSRTLRRVLARMRNVALNDRTDADCAAPHPVPSP
jgi:RNA polymerase sigma-B factor